MAQMSRNIFVLFLLCVVLLIIVGVAFPSYLSRKNLKLRSTFNSSVVSFNAVSSEKLIFKSPENNISNRNESSVLSKNNEVATEINVSYGTSNSSLMPIKVKRRAKRQTSSNGSELFNWNFMINVTRFIKPKEEISKDLNTSITHSGVAVYLESKEPKEIAFNEMQAAFKSVKSFLIDLFKMSYENATTDMVEKKNLQYFTESPWVEPDHTTIDSFGDGDKMVLNQPDIIGNETSHPLNKSLHSTEQVTSENIDGLKSELRNNDSTQTDRKARIFFGLFSLGGKSLRKTTSEPETTLITVEDKDRNIELNENVTDQFPHEAMFFSINSQNSSIHTDSFKSETESSKVQPKEQKSDTFDLLFVTQQADCLNCNTVKSKISNLPNEHDSSKTDYETTSKPNEHLSDKTLRNLCMQILSNLKESQTPFSGKENDIKDQFRSSQNLSIDSLNSLIPKEVEELNTHMEIDDSFFVSREGLPTENSLSLSKQARFLNIFGLGSGRSEIINEGNLIFEKEPDEPRFTNLPSVLDCEKFSKNWNRELATKWNHTSYLNTTHNIQELVFLENDSNQASENKNIDENRTSFGTGVSLVVNKDILEVTNENKDIEENNGNLIELTESQTINSRQNVQDATDGQSDGRIFSFFDFGSGNGRDASVTNNLRFFGIFGSGMRSLDSRESDESNDLGSGIPFQAKVSVDENYSSERDSYEDVSVTSAQERRFLGIFGIGGSGEGRDIADSTDFITEYNIHINCGNDCSHGATEQPYECSDNCDLDYGTSNSSAEFSQIDSKDCEGNCNTSIVGMHGEDFENLTSESFGLDFSLSSENFFLKISEAEDITSEVTDVGCDDCDYDKFIDSAIRTEAPSYVIERTVQTKNNGSGENHDGQIHSRGSTEDFSLNYSTDKFDYEQNTESSAVEHETTEKIGRFMGTIFLTGSGDGGLFGDDGGPINLVEEENSIGSNRNPRRRGRLDDAGLDVLFQNAFDSLDENPGSPVSNPHDIVSFTGITKDSVEQDENEAVNSSTVPFLHSPNITQIRIPIKHRSCSGARDCNDTLNERCMTVNASSICECGRSFVRHKETGKCVAKSLVETWLQLPGESFDEDLRNPASPRYKQMSEKSKETIYLLLHETPNILRVVTDVNVTGFASGSLIVKLNFVLATEKENPSESLKYMENELQKALKHERVLKRASLNVTDASFQPFKSEVNRCKRLELNYCSKYADCVWKEDYPEEFICKCKEHYLDVPTNSSYPGEICVAKCTASFCGSHGHCEVLDNEKRHCVCYDLYFGERCEYSGVAILCSLSIIALISLIVVFVVILKLGCKTSSYGRTPTFRRAETPGHAIANCRLSDAIALGESRSMKVSKFSQISTPVPEPPFIKVTRPTLNESSISFDCDSTFDMSNTDEKTV